eukprot:m.145882 g.145882  ORF g.145882 m.145882 type:complete len:58 (-) comp105523_c0_seq1:15-188(-)
MNCVISIIHDALYAILFYVYLYHFVTILLSLFQLLQQPSLSSLPICTLLFRCQCQDC